MKKSCLFTVIAFLVLVNNSYGQAWVGVGSAGFSDGQANGTTIAIDTGGTPYVVYSDLGHGQQSTVMKYTSGGWVDVGAAGFSGSGVQVGNTCIAINDSGTPYVVFSADPSGSSTGYGMIYNDSDWVFAGTTGQFSESGAAYTSIALGDSGALYVAFNDGDHSGKATVMRFANGNWDTVGMPGFSAGQADYTSIAIDTGGTPYVAYSDYGYGGKVTVMKYTGGSWVNVGSPAFSGGEANYTCLAINRNGVPYVVYEDTGMAATAMMNNGSGWVLAGIPAFSGGQATSISTAIDSSGMLYAVYQDGMHDGKATVMKYPTTGGGSWSYAGNAGFSAAEVQYTSIAIGNGGTPYVVYQDQANSSKATVMKLDTSIHTSGVKNINNNATSIKVFPDPNNGVFTINISDAQKEDATVIVTNMLGEKVRAIKVSTNMDNEVRMDDVTGVYFLSAETSEGRITRKVVVE